jgi:hypothetical protein
VTGHTLENAVFTFGPVGFQTEPALELVGTNLWETDGAIRDDVGLNEALYFRFSRDIDIDNPHNMVYVTRGGGNILVDWGWSADHLQLNITPVGTLLPETDYTVFFVVNSPIANDMVSMAMNFSTVSNLQPPSQVTNVALDEDALFDWDTQTIWLSWDTQPLAAVYHVYAWDENHATDRINIGAFTAAAFGRQRQMVTLPLEFDWLTTDAIQTPFSGGNRVHLAVRAINDAAAAPLSADVVAEDNVAPAGFTLSQSQSMNNSAGADPITVTVRITNAIEYCGGTPPIWGFTEAGGSPTYVLPHDAAEWTWDGNHCNGNLVVTVPAHRNGAGDQLSLTGLVDNSGNVQSDLVVHVLF